MYKYVWVDSTVSQRLINPFNHAQQLRPVLIYQITYVFDINILEKKENYDSTQKLKSRKSLCYFVLDEKKLSVTFLENSNLPCAVNFMLFIFDRISKRK